MVVGRREFSRGRLPVHFFERRLFRRRFHMRLTCRMLLACALVIWLVPGTRAQEPFKPGPEHEHLKQMEGTWDATVKFGGEESKGTMTYKMGLGDMWLLSHFEGQ